VTASPVVLHLENTVRRRGDGADGFCLEAPLFTVRLGDCIGLTGPSGSGKSTMLDLLGLVLRPDRAGTFEFRAGEDSVIDVAELWRRGRSDALARVRARHIGYVLQTGGLLPFLSALDNILLSRTLLGLGAGDGLVARLIEALGIKHLLKKKPATLSIGERQRVAIARALAHRPTLLLADEPTAALDPGQAHAVMALLKEMVRGLGIAAVIVTHDWALVSSLGLKEVRAAPAPCLHGSASRFSC
jgi:putative ABC transport system ATP-binding protein